MSLTAPPRAARRRPVGAAAPPVPARSWALVVLGALALSLLSLLGPAEPTYDPWAWIVWSREITEGTLTTTNGPSWKPLPVMLTTPFAFLGDEVAPAAWLVMARAGGLLAVAMAYRLGSRLAGRGAGAIAAIALLLADEFVRNFARGNSEGLLVTLVLFAIERHLDGRRGWAFALTFASALLRPELWPFLGLYGLYVAWRDPRLRLPVAAAFAALVVLWLGPEYVGSGNALRASDRARQPNLDSAAFATSPFLEVFRRSYAVLMLPVLVGALIAVVVAAREYRRGRGGELRLAFAAGAAVLMTVVAGMTQAGYAGNLRYVALPAALLCALAGAGWIELAGGAAARYGRRRAGLLCLLLVAASAPFVVRSVDAFQIDLRLTRDEAELNADLDRAIATAGGAAGVRACGGIWTGRFDTMPLAWRLHVPLDRVEIFPYGPGTIFAGRRFSLTRPRPSALSRDPRYPLVGGTRRWVVRARCG